MNIAQAINVEAFWHGIKNLNEINDLNADKNVELLAINVEGFWYGIPASIVPKFNGWRNTLWHTGRLTASQDFKISCKVCAKNLKDFGVKNFRLNFRLNFNSIENNSSR